jgi:hypothetical protein
MPLPDESGQYIYRPSPTPGVLGDLVDAKLPLSEAVKMLQLKAEKKRRGREPASDIGGDGSERHDQNEEEPRRLPAAPHGDGNQKLVEDIVNAVPRRANSIERGHLKKRKIPSLILSGVGAPRSWKASASPSAGVDRNLADGPGDTAQNAVTIRYELAPPMTSVMGFESYPGSRA